MGDLYGSGRGGRDRGGGEAHPRRGKHERLDAQSIAPSVRDHDDKLERENDN